MLSVRLQHAKPHLVRSLCGLSQPFRHPEFMQPKPTNAFNRLMPNGSSPDEQILAGDVIFRPKLVLPFSAHLDGGFEVVASRVATCDILRQAHDLLNAAITKHIWNTHHFPMTQLQFRSYFMRPGSFAFFVAPQLNETRLLAAAMVDPYEAPNPFGVCSATCIVDPNWQGIGLEHLLIGAIQKTAVNASIVPDKIIKETDAFSVQFVEERTDY